MGGLDRRHRYASRTLALVHRVAFLRQKWRSRRIKFEKPPTSSATTPTLLGSGARFLVAVVFLHLDLDGH